MTEITLPKPKGLNARHKAILKEFITATAEKRDPARKTVTDAVLNGLLARAGFDENNFPMYVLTDKGRKAVGF